APGTSACRRRSGRPAAAQGEDCHADPGEPHLLGPGGTGPARRRPAPVALGARRPARRPGGWVRLRRLGGGPGRGGAPGGGGTGRGDGRAGVGLTFEGLPPGVTLPPEAVVAGDRHSWRGVLRAGREAAPGTTAVRVHARAGKVHKVATVQFTVTAVPPLPGG